MSSENQNNTSNWRSKLDELESLPGEAILDKNASWEKLHEKLKGGKSNRKATWYWVAAASVLVVLMISLLNLIKEDHHLPKNLTVLKQPDKPTSSPSPAAKKDSGEGINPALLETNKTITFENKKDKINHSAISANVKNFIHVPDTASAHDAIAQSSDSVLQPADNILATAIISAKKKLPVIHINELDNSFEEEISVSHNNDRHFFVRLNNRDASSNTSIRKNYSPDNIFKINLSPQN